MSAITRLFALEQFGIKLGLEAMRVLLAALDDPQSRWPSVHVAGTNGKGSVAAMVDTALRASGRRVGRYTSPHLHRLEERVAIDGAPIASAALKAAVEDVFAAVDGLVAGGRLPAVPTFFEVSTAAGFLAFARAKVDVAVVEVGLGGRFDATNVVMPEVSAITTIAFDHERYLGSTLGAIAREKAGIAKRGVPLVVGDVPAEARAAITEVAATAGAPVVAARDGVTAVVDMAGGHAVARFTTPRHAYPPVRLGLAGRHQAANALVATRVLETLADRTGTPLAAEAIVTGLRDVRWPARLEWLRRPADGATLLVDAAHNPAGAQALAEYLHATGHTRLTLVTSVMADKDVGGVVGPLLPFVAHVVVTRAATPRAMAASSLAATIAALAPSGPPVVVEPDPVRAVERACAHGAPVVAAGSIYLVGPLRAALLAGGFESA